MKKNTVIPRRGAGVLLPVASLPGTYGIGSLGASARNWVDFLSVAGQSYWQILPLLELGRGNSPYQSTSAFAGEPLYIDLYMLRNDGLLRAGEYEVSDRFGDTSNVDYKKVRAHREKILPLAYARFEPDNAYDKFCDTNAYWLDNYAAFMANRSSAGEGYYRFLQYKFFSQWNELRDYAHSKGVEIIGDVPIYVAYDNADVFYNFEGFQLDADGKPICVAGVPPDYFSKTGQIWNNPLYDWDAMKSNGYRWWINRIKAAFNQADVIRIDHFRGFDSYWSVPFGEKTAENGMWRQGPGIDFINAVKREIPNARIIAEDLGYLTDSVKKLLKSSGFPGMKVLQFAFDTRGQNGYSPYTYPANSVVYTGTHDNDTVLGWSASAQNAVVKNAKLYLGVKRCAELPYAMIRLAFQSASNLAVIPIQDWLKLGSESRINTPSTENDKNWSWMLAKNSLSDSLANYMREITEVTGRVQR
jgi:4-alpha-glucanotransferase